MGVSGELLKMVGCRRRRWSALGTEGSEAGLLRPLVVVPRTTAPLTGLVDLSLGTGLAPRTWLSGHTLSLILTCFLFLVGL